MEASQDKKGPGLIRRALTFLLTAALVLGAVFLVANWQKLNFDSVRRYFTYRSLERDESGQASSFLYSGGSSSSFLPLGEDLLVYSPGSVRLYSATGGVYFDENHTLTNPVLSAGGSAGLVYDMGGEVLLVYRDREQVFSLTPEKGHSILSASLSAQGLLTVVTQASGVKGVVTVYDSGFQPKMTVSLSSRFITDALLSPDGSVLALATAGQSGGVFDSQIAFYRLDRPAGSSEPDATCSLGNDVVLGLAWPSGPLRVLGEGKLSFVETTGAQAGSFSYGGRYLKGYSLDGEGSCALLLGKYRAGSATELVTVDTAGSQMATLVPGDQVLSLSTAGRYLSVLTANSLTIYSGSFEEPYHILTELQGARKVLQRGDGSVLLISEESARLYLPD